MKSSLFRFLLFCWILAGSILLSGCGTTRDLCQEIRNRGILRVGTTGDYRPMSFRDPATGQYWGFDAALAEDLARDPSFAMPE